MLLLTALFALSTANSAAWRLTSNGFGPIRIGMTQTEVGKALHQKVEDDNPPDEDSYACHTASVASIPSLAFMFEDGRLTRLSLYGPGPIATVDGFSIGSAERAIRRRYGSHVKVESGAYDETEHSLLLWDKPGKRGVRFITSAHGRVRQIHAGGPSIQYVEGCD